MPGDPEVHATLGTLFLDGGLPGEAEPAFRRAIRIEPRAPAALVGAGRALLAMNRFDEAEAEFRAAAGLREDSPALCGLARALAAQDRAGEAESAYERVLARDPGDREAYAGLGSLLVAGERVAQAEALCRRVLAHDPARVDALYDLGTLLTRQGRLEEAEASYRGVLARRPDHLESRSCLLFLLHYAARRPPADLLEESRAFGAFASARAGRPFSGWTCDPRPARLRVGLVSGDLRNHPVGFFLEGLVATADPARIEWVAYPTYPESDELTARLHARIGTWRPLAGLADEEAARLIRDDGIHVLVDLAGHTVHNRLPVFAWRPAPVQVTWLGYFATTGMREMDWILADRVTLPPGLQAHFTERVRYLPDTRLCFTPPAGAPAPRPLPALANGFVTFGCFQAQPKITGEVLQAWARILAQVPGSRLRLQNESLSGAEGREALARRLAGAGIDVSRVGMHGFAPRAQYLDDCGKADFLLDTFPYPGGTTTCEALWMGVPTLTLAGESMIARQGAGLAAAAGLPGWVAQSVDDYVSRAVSLAGDVPGLASLRSTLRDRVARSPLFDAERFSRAFAQALWELWAASPAARAGGSASG
jgi:predicted O-linked N-acetylglucosamine transferase (SPINDLY family)